MFYNKIVNRVCDYSFNTFTENIYTVADKFYEFRKGELTCFHPEKTTICDRWVVLPKAKSDGSLDFQKFLNQPPVDI